ncbi:DnaT-like ssDNA-binding protein [Consotaella aegiceratis]|uniref:DnaT-like ssDNA-binding protein n=1 Tax=Consotaella aegiceratis TaxID=3097961 RepID=UPI002F4238E8
MAGYGTDQGLTDYAATVGYTIPDGATLAVARQLGSDYVDGLYGDRFPGEPTGGIEQERAWPRTGATIDGSTLAGDVIPSRVVNASYEAAMLQMTTPGILTKTFTPGERKVLTEVKGIKWEVVGSDAGAPPVVVSTTIEGMLAPLLLLRNIPSILVV